MWRRLRGGCGRAVETAENNQRPTAALETARREAKSEFRSRWDLNITWGPAKPLKCATVVSLVDSAREENKARAVAGIYLSQGR